MTGDGTRRFLANATVIDGVGDQALPAIDRGLGRPSMRDSRPVATSTSHRSLPKVKLLRANTLGWMRMPASLASGWATTSMPGNPGMPVKAMMSRRGLSDA